MMYVDQTNKLAAPPLRFAIYARFSTSMQKPQSIEDQFRLCRDKVRKMGGVVESTYQDAAISGKTMHRRNGLLRMLADALDGRFDAIFTEALDRLSRDQADMADIYRRLRFQGVRLYTSEEGEIDSMHVGIKGLMNEVYVEALAAKIRRGQKGQVARGRSPGSLCYGYRVANRIVDGKLIRGLREVAPDQAKVVRRIFRLCVDGMSTRQIARLLNEEGIPSPRGKLWTSVTINGHRQRCNGILVNRLYHGKLVYGRQRFVTHPDTGKRLGRTVPVSEWLEQDVPELRIVDDELWDKAQVRRTAGQDRRRGTGGNRPLPLSDLVRCGTCGGKMTVHSRRRYRCSARRETGACDNRLGIGVSDLENRTAGRLLEWVRTDRDWRTTLAEAVRELKKRRRKLAEEIESGKLKIERLLDIVETGGQSSACGKRIVRLEQEVALLEKERAGLPPASALVPRGVGGRLRAGIQELERVVAQETGDARVLALLNLHGLMEGIKVAPAGQGGHRDGRTPA